MTLAPATPLDSRRVTRDIEHLESVAFLAPGLSVTGDPLTKIRRLVEENRVEEARVFLASLPFQPFLEAQLQSWRRLLAPPVVRNRPGTGGDTRKQFAWLRENAERYHGQWVALTDDGLVAAAPTYHDLRAALADLSLPTRPLIHKLT